MAGLPWLFLAIHCAFSLAGLTTPARNASWLSGRAETQDLCRDSRCSCDFVAGLGTNITCRCSPQDKEADLSVNMHSTPRELAIFVIESCREVTFQKFALKGRGYLSAVQVRDAGVVQFEPHSVGSVNGRQSPVISISQCRELILHTGAFSNNIEMPVSFSAHDCQAVEVRESAFSRIHRVVLSGIPRLVLAPYSFRFPATSDQISKLQAEIAISNSVLVGGLQSFTFPSSFRQLIMHNVSMETIHTNATTALHVIRFALNASRIDTIAEQAFGESTHFDTLEVANTEIGNINSKAIRSAVSNLTLFNNNISGIHDTGLSITAARVFFLGNRIGKLRTGALHLREWNDLLVENNTFQLVERHAFYHIGDPKKEEGSDIDVRFVIRGNTILRADTGAFVFSAKAVQLELEDNYFWHLCECSLAAWAADLTQVTRRLQMSEALRADSSDSVDALWLGSALFSSSFCLVSGSEAKCSNLDVKFMRMTEYSGAFCPRQKDIADCVAQLAAQGVSERTVPQLDISETPLSKDSFNASLATPLGFAAHQNFLLVVILVVVAAVVILVTLVGVFLAKRRNQLRMGSGKNIEQDERVTCSPLLSHVEKNLGSGVVTSGSISRLSIKEYRNYVEDIGPIYSEPSDNFAHSSTERLNQQIPPELPAFPPQWTSRSSVSSSQGKRTIDRGTQTGDDIKSSLAEEFTADVLTALQDKMDISPTYSEVKDSIAPPQSDTQSQGEILNPRELYDSIRTAQPSAQNAPAEGFYCKPWAAEDSSVKQAPASKTAEIKPIPPEQITTARPKSTTTGSVPFYIRGSLPKWPPPSKPVPSTSRFKTSAVPPKMTSSAPAAQNKDTKPPWRAAALPKTPKTSTAAPKVSPASNDTVKSAENTKPVKSDTPSSLASEYAEPKDKTFSNGTQQIAGTADYSEVTPQPFSFSFRKPLFSRPNTDPTSVQAPPKPTRLHVPPLSEYTEPKDRVEPLYLEVPSKV